MKNLLKNSDFESNDELGRLEAELISFSESRLKMPDKGKVKRHLMEGLNSDKKERFSYTLERLIVSLKRSARSVVMPPWAKIMMKERILEYAESGVNWRSVSIQEGFGVFLQRASALLVLAVFAFGIVAVFPEKNAVTYAKGTFLDQVNGEVFVKRKLEMIKAKEDMRLEEGDVVVSEGESNATIRFFDDSISRLNEHTRLKIEKLYSEPHNPTLTNVELYLENGQIWTKVVNLMSDSEFVVDTDDLRADVEKKAAFDLSAQAGESQISVYENVVKVEPVKVESKSKKTVVAGYKAKSGDLGLKIEKLPRNEVLRPTNEWIVANLDSDKQYNQDLIADVENNVMNQDKDSEQNVKSMDLPGTDNHIERFEKAYQSFLEGESKLVSGDKEGAEALLKEFEIVSGEIIAELPALTVNDPQAAEVLKVLMKEKLAAQTKDLSSALPGNSLYDAKEVMQDFELAMAETEVGKAEIQLEQAGDILLEIEQLIADDQDHLASSLLKRYQNKTNGITLNLSEENMKEVKERLLPILEGQAEHMKTLTAIENSIIYRNQNELKEKVNAVREDTLRKFAVALEQMPESVPESVLYDVQDLYVTYSDESGEELDIIEPVYEKLTDTKQTGVKFINPQTPQVPSEMGIFMMVPSEGTADVVSKAELRNSHVKVWAAVESE